jgi:peptidoglycan/LPS O-acetylase OafA/YrhL
MYYASSRAVKAAYAAPLATAGYVSEVDALRCVAMTAVVAQHCNNLLPFGCTGVWLFYVISGFAITSSLLASDRLSPPKPLLLRNFYAKRCLRIWPLYFLVVGPTLVAAAIAGQSSVLGKGPWLVTFTYNYYSIFHPGSAGDTWGWFGHLWTISVEEQFYPVFPFLFAFLSRRRLTAALWICVALGPILRTLLTWGLDQLSWDDENKFGVVYVFAPAHFDAFAAGALLALFRSFLALRLDFARVFLAVALGAAAVYTYIYLSINVATAGFNYHAFNGVIYGEIWGQGRQVWIFSVIAALASALIALILAGEGWLLNVCRLPLLRPIGRISYGAYVYHLPVLYVYGLYWPFTGTASSRLYGLTEFAFAYPVTLLIAFLSFRYFEEPILRLRARFPAANQVPRLA